MSEIRTLPLHSIAVRGRYGAEIGTPGVTLSIIYPVSLVSVIARKGKSKALASALAKIKNATVMNAGPDQFYIQSALPLYAELKSNLNGIASVIDQSHGRVVIRIAGPKSCAVLAKGTPIDLHTDHFPLNQSAQTQMAHVGIHITRSGEDEFTLSVFRGFSESFWEWLTLSSAEFGYIVQ